MGARVGKIDMSGVGRKLNLIATHRQLGVYAAEQAARLMEPFVPMDTGALAASAGKSQPWVVTYDTPYAKAQYYGFDHNFSKEKHPSAKAKWDEGPDWQDLGDLLTAKARTL